MAHLAILLRLTTVGILIVLSGCMGQEEVPPPTDEGDDTTSGNETTGGGSIVGGGNNITITPPPMPRQNYHAEYSENISEPTGYTMDFPIPVSFTGAKTLKAQLTAVTATPAGDQPLVVNVTVDILDPAQTIVQSGSVGPQTSNSVTVEVPTPVRGVYTAHVSGQGADVAGVVTTKYTLVIDVLYT